MRSRLLLTAFDGLDWGLMQALVDAGRMPSLERMLEAGASGRLAVPPPPSPASAWTTVATGMLADRHGICHEWAVRPDGLSVGEIGSESLRSRTFWQCAMTAGMSCRIVGWPALLRTDGEVDPVIDSQTSCLVAGGFGNARHATADTWPLSPFMVWPSSARAEVFDALVHPAEVAADAVAEMLISVPAAHHRCLDAAARELLARWSSIQALTLAWARRESAALTALHFDGLPTWMAELQARVGPRLPSALTSTYILLDMIVGQHLRSLDVEANVVVVSLHGLPHGGYRPGSRRPETLYDALPSGGIVIVGPKVPRDSLLPEASAPDVCPTLLALLGLTQTDPGLDGRDLLAVGSRWRGAKRANSMPAADFPDTRRVPQDEVMLQWLEQGGVPRIDLGAMCEVVKAVEDQTLFAWAQARLQRGNCGDALAALRGIVQRSPAYLPARVALGRALIDAGSAAECTGLLHDLPPQLLGADHEMWLDTFSAIIARAKGDVVAATACLSRLIARGKAPINAPAWLGWVRLDSHDPGGAVPWFHKAMNWPGDASWVFEGLGVARLRCSQDVDAARAFTQAIAEKPSCARLYAYRARAWGHAGELQLAEQDWQRAIELEPAQPSHVEGLARIWSLR